MKYAVILPLLLVACGFDVNPLGHSEPNSSADEIATIGGHHLDDASEMLDAEPVDDSDAAEPSVTPPHSRDADAAGVAAPEPDAAEPSVGEDAGAPVVDAAQPDPTPP